uniref:Uncharacterized protein n=1 Tax=Oryza barthii TaxID=65489 RepID=A0A0D3H105_9ORYZ
MAININYYEPEYPKSAANCYADRISCTSPPTTNIEPKQKITTATTIGADPARILTMVMKVATRQMTLPSSQSPDLAYGTSTTT